MGYWKTDGAGGETGKNRHFFLPFASGNGVDLGCGSDPIHERAVRVDRTVGHGHLLGDVTDLYWFADGSLDYVYASHVLEDFADWQPVLTEWVRVLRPGGRLLIAVPDHEKFRAAVAGGQGDNLDHKHESYPGEISAKLAEYGLPVTPMFDDFIRPEEPRDYNVVFVGKKH
jgi:ubiquinone/menaquinone biosynthesis C-methylase UbiE